MMTVFISTLRLTEQGPILQIPTGFADFVDSANGKVRDRIESERWLAEHSDYPVVFVASPLDSQYLVDVNDAIPFAYRIHSDDNVESNEPLSLGHFDEKVHESETSTEQFATNLDIRLHQLQRQLAAEIRQHSETRLALKTSRDRLSQAHSIIHDINNHLLVVYFSSKQLLESLPENDPNRQTVVSIQETRNQANELTRQFQKVRQNEIVARQQSTVDLNDFIIHHGQVFRPLIRDDVILSVMPDSNLAVLESTPDIVDQIVLNLLLNALSAIPGGGWVTIETRHEEITDSHEHCSSNIPPGQYLRLSVRDTRSERVDHKQDPELEEVSVLPVDHQRLDRISVVRKLVKQIGGRVDMISTDEDGTRVDVRFPGVRSRSITEQLHDAKSLPTGGAETILLVEDDAPIRQFVKKSLESVGYQVIECRDGQTALKFASEESSAFELLLTDLTIPDMSGFAIADSIRAIRTDLTVIFMSGSPNEETESDASIRTSAPFLQKPFQKCELLAIVRQTLDSRRP